MGATLGEQLQRFCLATVAYTELLLLPNQRAMHALSLDPWNRATPWSVAGGVLIAIGAVVPFAVWMRRDRPLAWMLAATILALLPVSNLLPMPFLLYAPYRAAVASIGVVAILARLLSGLRAELQGFRAAPAAMALACVASWYSMQTVQGIPTFENEPQLFSTVVAYDPDSVVAHYMLAKLASDAGDNKTAAQHLAHILTYIYGSNRWQDPQHALQLFEQDRGVRMRALQNQGQRGDPKPYMASLFRHLGFTRMQMGDTDGALTALETALAWDPRNPELHHGLGWCYAQKAQYERAATHLVQAVNAEPTVERRQLLAQVFERLGRYQEAAEQWRLAAAMAARGSSGQ
jgi:tetratricopeptide (TPR) repeat protein